MDEHWLYLELNTYGAKAARPHMNHCSRSKSRIANPLVERYGVMTDEQLLTQVVGRTKPLRIRYVEIMTYTRGIAEMRQVRKYLERKLARSIVIYRHLDEAAEHCHFLARNAGPDRKALRVMWRGLAAIKKGVAQILNKQVPARGAGPGPHPVGRAQGKPAGACSQEAGLPKYSGRT
jgi:hypothetical protein